MKIAQVAPLIESVPPKLYGGTERVVSYLTEELVRQGHEVTLYASADSQTAAELRPAVRRALRLEPADGDPLAHHYVMLEQVLRESDGHEIVHYHTDFLHHPFARRQTAPHVTTMHGRLDLAHLRPIFAEYAEMPLVSISRSQRRPLRRASWCATIPHGLPTELLPFHPEPGRYLAFLGRMSSEKRPDRAIEIARRAGWSIRLAAKVDPVDVDYFESRIKPMLDGPGVEYIGEISDREKGEFLGGAAAVLFPIDWPEPFGLVMIESMACGTPVIAFPGGAVDEVMEHGVTGFVARDIDDAVRAVGRLDELDRRVCRETFERRFSVAQMARRYVEVYERVRAGAPVGAFQAAS